jgi:predicted DNA-binding transcriptional regulator AlpA
MTTHIPLHPGLPETGYLRLPQILRFIPIGKSTWWKWVAEGKAPKPVKLGVKTTAWKVEDIRALIRELGTSG